MKVKELIELGFELKYNTCTETGSEVDFIYFVFETKPEMVVLMSSEVELESCNESIDEVDIEWLNDQLLSVSIFNTTKKVNLQNQEIKDITRWMKGVIRRLKNKEI